jgi:uncharacterized protein (TIGR02270 family)
MPLAPDSERPDDGILRDVVDEHLAEAEFLVEQVERAFDSSTLALKQLASGVEARLAAHLDALALGEGPVHERVLAKVLAEPDPDEPARFIAAALVALGAGRFDALPAALGHVEAPVRDAAVRACSLARGDGVDDWLWARLRGDVSDDERGSLLFVLARRGLEPPPLLAWLQAEAPRLVRAAAEAARLADPTTHAVIVEHLLGHEDAGVREAAMIASLAWGSHRALPLCEAWALEDRPHPLPMALSAMLGDAAHHARLAEKVASPAHRRAALFALGFSGNPAVLPVLTAHVGGADPVAAKIAAQAIATLVGIDLDSDAFVAKAPPPKGGAELPPASEDPEAKKALPPLEEDDLDADLPPPPEAALPTPNAEAIRCHCEKVAPSMAAPGRYLGGQPVGVATILDSLDSSPLRRRHVLALGAGIHLDGRAWIDTRAFSDVQRRQTAAARAVRGGHA